MSLAFKRVFFYYIVDARLDVKWLSDLQIFSKLIKLH